MREESDQILQLQKELVYYKKQVDKLSGNTISTQYALAQLSNVCKKYRNCFQIIADLQRSFSFYSMKDSLYEQFMESIFSQMFLDRVALLETIPGTKEFKPVLWKGFSNTESNMLKETSLAIPEIFLQDKRSILVNSSTVTNTFEKYIQEKLFTSFFILIPLIKNQQVWGALFVGMQHEFRPMSYIPLSGSNIDMFESIAGMISAMTQQLEQREIMEMERNRIARDMHDDIGSSLSKISVTCENLKSQFATSEPVIKSLDIIKESTGSIVDSIGNIIWALNPVNNTLDSLVGYLREYTFEYLEMHHLEVTFDLPEIEANRIISHEVRTHIFMVVKEVLHNIVKHASAKNININLSVNAGKLSCTIADDGKGFSPQENRLFGNGLRNMKQRIGEMGGILSIHSEHGKGTRVELEAPF